MIRAKHRVVGLSLLATFFTAPLGCDSSDGDGGDTDGGDDASWEGRNFRLVVPEGNWTQPPRVGGEIGPFVPQFLIGFGEAEDGEVEVLLAPASPETGEQQMCTPTTSVTLSAPDTPNEIGPLEFPARLGYEDEDEPNLVDAVIHDLEMTDVLPTGPEPLEEGIVLATMDMREINTLFTQLPVEPTPENACGALSMLGEDVGCTACNYPGGDGEPYCLELKAVLLEAEEDDELEIMEIDESDIGDDCDL